MHLPIKKEHYHSSLLNYAVYPFKALFIRDITDKAPKYFSGYIVALNHEFSIFCTYSGRFAALNQDFGCNLWSGATKCPEKFSVALSVMSLFEQTFPNHLFNK